MNSLDFLTAMSKLWEGFGFTLKLFALTLVISIPLGLLFAFISMSRFKPLAWLMKTVIWVIRGTPLLLQCTVMTFIPYVFKIPAKTVASFFHIAVVDLLFLWVLIAFSLNYACYFAVIFEGGIKNVPKGQSEAGQVLGLTKRQIFSHVILLQVIRRILAPMSNEIITLVKDTAIANALGVFEIIFAANKLVNDYVSLTPLLYAGVFYLVFSGLLTVLFHFLEKKIGYYDVT